MVQRQHLLWLVGMALLAVSSGVRAEGDVAGQLQAALDKEISASEPDEVILKDLPELLEKYLPSGMQVKVSGDWLGTTPFRRLRGLRVGAALELAQDTLSGAQVVVRGYGFLITTEDKIPSRGIPLHEFWKGASPGAKNEIDALKKQLAEKDEQLRRQAAVAKEAQAQALQMKERLEQALKENIQLAQEREAAREALLAAEVAQKAAQQRAEQLEAHLREWAREREKRKEGEDARAKPPAKRNPPAEQVEGTVQAVEEKSGQVEVDIGADAGLKEGQTLEVFRLKPPKYLGTIRILKVEPKKAVGRPEGNLADKVQVGDRVGSRILGK